MEDDNKKKLINETVTGRRLTFRRAMRYAAIAAICGVAFGAAASLTHPLIDHIVSKSESESERKAAESESEQGAAGQSDTLNDSSENAAADGAGNEPSPNENPEASSGEDSVQPDNGESEVNNYSTNSPYPIVDTDDAEKYKAAMLSVRSDAIEKAAASLITLSVTSQSNTWFDSEMESTAEYSGIIIGTDDKEILILAPYIEADDRSLKVTFANGSKADAYLKQSSETDGLSVITVSASDGVSSETLKAISAAEYADSSELECGMSVIATGSPLGVIDSCSFGTIGYISDAEPGIDCAQYVFYSDMAVDPSKGTFIIDYDGKLIGVASSVSGDVSSESGYSRIVGISSLQRIINSMMTGSKKAYLGIIGMDVDFDMKYSSVPEGVYVSDVVNDSPAYNAGIRHGDVITAIAERSVEDVASMSRILGSQKPGVTVTVKLMRGSVNSEYRELDFELTLGER